MSQQLEDFLGCLQLLDTSIYKPQEQACIPVFRSLPPNLRTIIQRMVFFEERKVPESIIQAQNYQQSPNTILDLAIQLKLITKQEERQQQAVNSYYYLDSNFQNSLRDSIEGKSKSILTKIGDCTENKELLKRECSRKWKDLFDLISRRDRSDLSCYRQQVRQTLIESKLLERNLGVGFSFILSSTHKQINQILKYYVTKQSSNVVRFILCLSVLDPMKIYQMPNEEWQKNVIKDLQEFGLTHYQDQQMRITFLFWNFLYEPPSVSIGIQCNIIVEANFRIYAYLNSGDQQEEEILCNLLNLFSEIKKRFKILIIADLSESSIRKAVRENLQAKQIIQFLEMNSKQLKQQAATEKQHKSNDELKKRLDFLRVFQEGVPEKAIIPHNVVQQIQYWESFSNIK
ncbi:unnamed protein product (macronuclear) [Paramecium tetraurelia]|uniref:General transcription factor IIH subunit 4 n=1 Tax=Paramecium tetraurelia TaxID=5888 RepID=A0CQP0_PARTE|nr:uncharacterized protein GSPATT00009455001 [Paramecium tetraurelia]CAK73107.1 unnamed protein product [Paramecium tetraurelia]|eukprot:XP_001440504.1 hypothetical protein (macronuclear) [Paramecium tetraurelia strain d4-2]